MNNRYINNACRSVQSYCQETEPEACKCYAPGIYWFPFAFYSRPLTFHFRLFLAFDFASDCRKKVVCSNYSGTSATRRYFFSLWRRTPLACRKLRTRFSYSYMLLLISDFFMCIYCGPFRYPWNSGINDYVNRDLTSVNCSILKISRKKKHDFDIFRISSPAMSRTGFPVRFRVSIILKLIKLITLYCFRSFFWFIMRWNYFLSFFISIKAYFLFIKWDLFINNIMQLFLKLV